MGWLVVFVLVIHIGRIQPARGFFPVVLVIKFFIKFVEVSGHRFTRVSEWRGRATAQEKLPLNSGPYGTHHCGLLQNAVSAPAVWSWMADTRGEEPLRSVDDPR